MRAITPNQRISGATNLKGYLRSPLLELYTQSLQSRSKEKKGDENFYHLWRQTAPVLYVRRGQKDGKRGYKLSTETGQVHSAVLIDISIWRIYTNTLPSTTATPAVHRWTRS